VFEAMVQHVQYSGFSQVATLDVPAEYLGWTKNQQGTWQLFELRITRTDGKKTIVLRRELTSYVVPAGGNAVELKPELVEHMTEMTQGPSQVDVDEARRAFEIGRKATNERLKEMKDEVRTEDSKSEVIPAVSEFALAWIRAV
jgi:hypothetical protein